MLFQQLILCAAALLPLPLPPQPSAVADVVPETTAVVVDVVPIGARVLLVHPNGSTTSAPLASVQVEPLTLTLSLIAQPTVYETTYSDDANNQHRVITDCRNMASLLNCAQMHRKALEAMQGVFPPRQQ